MLNMLKPNNIAHSDNPIHIHQALSIMGVTQWHLRDALFVSPDHSLCQFHAILTQSLGILEKAFLINLYRAIEKLLKISPSEHLIQKKSTLLKEDINNFPNIKLCFNSKHALIAIQAQDPILIIDLPGVIDCAKNPVLKTELWKILKNNI